MRRLAALLVLSSLFAGARVDAAPKPKKATQKEVDVKRPPRALPSIARRIVDQGPIVVTLARPGSAEVAVVFSVPRGKVDPIDASVAARAVFHPTDEARARGVSRQVRVEDGAVLVVDTAPAAELPFVLFSLGSALGVAPSLAAVDAARFAYAADAEQRLASLRGRLQGVLESQVARPPSTNESIGAAATALFAARPTVAVVGDADTARVVGLVEQHFAARVSTESPRPSPSERVVARAQGGAAPPARATLDAQPGLVWTIAVDPAPIDAGGELALFLLRRRLGAKPADIPGAVTSFQGFVLPGDAPRLEKDVARVLDDLSQRGPTVAELASFRAARESEALSRGLVDWAVRLTLAELSYGDARYAGRELAWAWEVDDIRLKRALSSTGPLAGGFRHLVVMGPSK